jgi:hypothetical protein
MIVFRRENSVESVHMMQPRIWGMLLSLMVTLGGCGTGTDSSATRGLSEPQTSQELINPDSMQAPDSENFVDNVLADEVEESDSIGSGDSNQAGSLRPPPSSSTQPPPTSPPPPSSTTQPPPTSPQVACHDTHGMLLPARHTLNTLVLFIRHRDEDHRSGWWPADGFPQDWRTVIDSTQTQDSRHFYNLTHFYREASANAAVPFTLIGRVDTVTADLSISHAMPYGEANRLVLRQVEGRYGPELGDWLDRWSRNEFCHTETSDGTIDLIILVWRSNRFNGGGLFWSGIAMIGEADTTPYRFLGKRIILPGERGFISSGVTVSLRERSVRDGLLTQDAVFKTIVHEIAHNHISFSHPQGGGQGMQRFPSMLTYSEQQIHTHNGREAAQLGWGRMISVTTDTTLHLGDFYETGQSVWIHTGRHYYLVENRQKTSIYDDASANPDDKGLFVYRYSTARAGRIQYDGRNTSITPFPSDGFHDWTFTGRWLPGWLAIFSRAEPNPSDGSGYTRRQPTGGGNHHWISAIDDGNSGSSGDFRGSGLHAAFNMDHPRLGPDTNPMADDLELVVQGQSENTIQFSVRILQ